MGKKLVVVEITQFELAEGADEKKFLREAQAPL